MRSLFLLGSFISLLQVGTSMTISITSTIVIDPCVPTPQPTVDSSTDVVPSSTPTPSPSSSPTPSPSSIASSSASAPSSCPSHGMIYDVFQTGPNAPKRYQPQTYPPDFPHQFNPNVYNGDAGDYLFSGAGDDINFSSYNDPNQLPDTQPYAFLPGKPWHTNTANVVIVYHGYFNAPVDGTYTLQLNQSTDNIAYIWTGDKAYSGWNSGNYDAFIELWTPSPHSSFQLPAQAANLIPVTILWVNQGEPGVMQLNIVDPDGTVKTDTTGYFEQPGCGSAGAQFNSPPKGCTPTQGPPPAGWA